MYLTSPGLPILPIPLNSLVAVWPAYQLVGPAVPARGQRIADYLWLQFMNLSSG
jgi:hypothetical protein